MCFARLSALWINIVKTSKIFVRFLKFKLLKLISTTTTTVFLVIDMLRWTKFHGLKGNNSFQLGERDGSVVECRTPEREVGGSKPTAAVLCPWARHFTPRKYWLITQEAVAPSRHDWKIVLNTNHFNCNICNIFRQTLGIRHKMFRKKLFISSWTKYNVKNDRFSSFRTRKTFLPSILTCIYICWNGIMMEIVV